MRLAGVLTLLLLTASPTAHAQETVPLAEPRLVPVPPEAPSWRPGEPAPPGFRIEHHPNQNLVGIGTRILAASYVASAITAGPAQVDNQTGWLFVPLAGPWLTLALRDTSCGSSGVGECASEGVGEALLASWLIILGAGQAAGAVVLTVGLADQRERLVYAGRVQFVPARIGRDGHGLTLRGSF